jgi:hypothetical protein
MEVCSMKKHLFTCFASGGQLRDALQQMQGKADLSSSAQRARCQLVDHFYGT